MGFGIFGNEALRVLRTRWANPNMLAQELFAIFSSTGLPINTDGPITQTRPANASVPGLTMQGYQPGDTAIQIGAGDNSVSIGPDGITIAGSPVLTEETGGSGRSAGGGVFPAQVLAPAPNFQAGANQQIYSVNVWANGLLFAPKQVLATQLYIDPNETIPNGTWTTVLLAGDGKYYMQIPTWLPAT